jgi:hypothetical protein
MRRGDDRRASEDHQWIWWGRDHTERGRGADQEPFAEAEQRGRRDHTWGVWLLELGGGERGRGILGDEEEHLGDIVYEVLRSTRKDH